MVVEPQPIDHFVFCLTACLEAHSVQPLDLQRTEERFGHSVIPAIAFSAHRTAHAEGRELLLEVAAGVLAAAVRMKDQPRRGSSAEPGHAQCIDDQCPRHALAHREADDLTAEQIDDDREIEPAFLRPEIGDVAGPDTVRRFDAKVALQQVRRDRKPMRTVRRRLELALATRLKTVGLHQLAHALLARPNAARQKLTPDTRPAIGALHLIENRLDVNQQGHIADPATRLKGAGRPGLTRAILMIAAGADVQRPTLRRYRPDFCDVAR